MSDNSGMGANGLAGCVIAGVGLGWVAEHYFPGIKPWGMVCGVLLGAAAGFFQVLGGEDALKKYRPKGKGDDGKPGQP